MKKIGLSVSLLAFTALAAEAPPFDAPKELQMTAPAIEAVEGMALSAGEITASVKEAFQALPDIKEEDEVSVALAPDPVQAPILLTAPEKEITPRMDAKAAEEASAPLVQQLAVKPKETAAAAVEKTVADAQQTFPAARVEPSASSAQVSLREVFAGAPLIYSVLFVISIATVALWLFTQMNMRTHTLMPPEMVAELQEKMSAGKLEEALAICQGNTSLLGRMVRSGLQAEHKNKSEMFSMMESEGKRMSGRFWRKLGLLNDVAIVAPMIGLLGTVVGMFYAFYDINRSAESMNTLFDGLGISVGTTVAGLVLAIAALVLHSSSKYRLVKQLTRVESTANALVSKLYEERKP